MTSTKLASKLPIAYLAFLTTVLGAFLLLIGMNPGLQPKRGEDAGPGSIVQVAGHTLTWSGTAVLAYRGALETRQLLRAQGEAAREEQNRGLARPSAGPDAPDEERRAS